MLKPEFMSDQSDPSVKEWGRIMAARAHGRDVSADEADVARPEDAVFAAPTSFRDLPMKKAPDPVNMPDHYTQLPVECIDVTEHFNFTLGNAIKYIWRADHKGKPLEDLRKAVWYLQREIARRERTGD